MKTGNLFDVFGPNFNSQFMHLILKYGLIIIAVVIIVGLVEIFLSPKKKTSKRKK